MGAGGGSGGVWVSAGERVGLVGRCQIKSRGGVKSSREPRKREARRGRGEALGAAVLAFGPAGALARPAGPQISHGFYPGFDRPEGPHGGQGDDPDADQADSRE